MFALSEKLKYILWHRFQTLFQSIIVGEKFRLRIFQCRNHDRYCTFAKFILIDKNEYKYKPLNLLILKARHYSCKSRRLHIIICSNRDLKEYDHVLIVDVEGVDGW